LRYSSSTEKVSLIRVLSQSVSILFSNGILEKVRVRLRESYVTNRDGAPHGAYISRRWAVPRMGKTPGDRRMWVDCELCGERMDAYTVVEAWSIAVLERRA